MSCERTFALAKICGGMTLSGPKACRGSMKEASTWCDNDQLKLSEDSTIVDEVSGAYLGSFLALTGYGARKGIVDSEGHLLYRSSAFKR